MRTNIVISGMLIAGAGFSAGYFLNLPYTSYVVGVGLLLLIIGMFTKPKPKIA